MRAEKSLFVDFVDVFFESRPLPTTKIEGFWWSPSYPQRGESGAKAPDWGGGDEKLIGIRKIPTLARRPYPFNIY